LSANVEFSITAFDEASSVFEDLSSNASECFDNVESSASEMASSVNTSTATVADNQPLVTNSFQSNALAINNVATASAGLVMGVYSLESAEVSLDRAHLMVEKDTTAVTLAQQAYNKAVLDYGANSSQAKDAADKLKDAQDTLSVAQERVQVAQNNMNSAVMMSTVMIIPSAITMFSGLNTFMTTYPGIATAVTGATEAVGTAFDFLAANPIVLVIVGIAALAVGLYEAYEHCAPFRDAVNDIGSVLEGAFKTALTGVEKAVSALGSAFGFLWNDILKPVGEFLKDILVADLDAVLAPINMFESAIGKVTSAVKPLTDIVGGLGNALKALCFAHAAPAADEFNTQVSKSVELSRNLTEKLELLKNSLMSVSGANVNQTALGGGTQHITVNPTINIGKIDRMTGLNDVINAVNQGTAQALQRRF